MKDLELLDKLSVELLVCLNKARFLRGYLHYEDVRDQDSVSAKRYNNILIECDRLAKEVLDIKNRN